ncbi:MAG TPA: hypothetical protein VNV13_06260, partial [Steroidobacteraceae bacterium]|nr:hypothetical protein [Steroidobacteraceae bacterium]
MHEPWNSARIHFRHYPSAVYLHRLFHDPKIQRDPLVGPATDYLFHDFSLARCQCAETLFD